MPPSATCRSTGTASAVAALARSLVRVGADAQHLVDALRAGRAVSVGVLGASVAQNGGCLDTCFHAGDGGCDDGGSNSHWSLSSFGTDCGDCGPRDSSELEDLIAVIWLLRPWTQH